MNTRILKLTQKTHHKYKSGHRFVVYGRVTGKPHFFKTLEEAELFDMKVAESI